MAGTVQPYYKPETSPFETGAATHVGNVRRRNEDSYLVQPDTGIWAVADGMGGHDDGDIASTTLVDALRAIERPTSAADLLTRCEESVTKANTKLQMLATERGGNVIGTTVAILLVHGIHFACVWCGDSRIYRLREGKLLQLSRDHTEVQELIDSGRLSPDEAKNWPRRNVITRAIGVQQQPELEIKDGALAPGDVFLICTDGLTGLIADTEIYGALENGGCQAACEALVDMTLARGAYDNVTVVAVRYNPKIENGEIESEDPIIGKENVRAADAQNTIPLATEGPRLRRHD